MKPNFTIRLGIELNQGEYSLDLHNNLEFVGCDYSVKDRTLTVRWEKGQGDWVPADTPQLVEIIFKQVSEYRFMPRDPEMPFTEDDCLVAVGAWHDGIYDKSEDTELDLSEFVAFEFHSGAIIIVKAEEAEAVITA